jgi:hypothetical protein
MPILTNTFLSPLEFEGNFVAKEDGRVYNINLLRFDK